MAVVRWVALAGLLVTWSVTQVRSQVFVTERRDSGPPQLSQPEGIAPESDRDASPDEDHRPPRPRQNAEDMLLARIAKLELLDTKLSKVDVLEKVFHFVQLDANVARISDQVDRLSERLSEQGTAASCPTASSDVQESLTSLSSRLGVLEKTVEGVASSVDSHLGRLHSQLDALLEKNVQLNTKTDVMREGVSQLLLASEVVDDQLEQADSNLRFLRDELDIVKQKVHNIHHQQHKSETVIKDTTVAVQEKIDAKVAGVEQRLQLRMNLVKMDLALIIDAIWRTENESIASSLPDYDDDDVVYHPLEDADFRAKLVNEIRSAVSEDAKKLIGVGCRRGKESQLPDLLKANLFREIQTTINSSLERAASAQWRPSDCSDVHRQSTASGLFTIFPNACSRGHKMKVYCDMETAGGGWTVIQRRGKYPDRQSVEFYNDWSTYKWGFGNLSEEFYLGNELIHLLASSDDFVLRIELEDFSGDRRYAEYEHFSIDDEARRYRLHVGKYSGNAGDAMSYHDGLGFTTKDQEHDTWPGKNCARHYRGGWWFGSCHKANLNGAYLSGHHSSYGNGIVWYPWRGYYYSLRSSRMMVRPRRVHEIRPPQKR